MGLKLADKDINGDGFVDLDDLMEPTSIEEGLEEIVPKDLGALLEALGLGDAYGESIKEIELEALKSLLELDTSACLNELKEAGMSLRDRIKVVQSLCHGILETPQGEETATFERKNPIRSD